MARASSGVRMAVACTMVSAFWMGAGPAQADVGDLVGSATGAAGGGAVRDSAERPVKRTVGEVTRTVDKARPAVDTVQDTVDKVQDTVDKVKRTTDQVQRTTDTVLEDPVREVTRHVEPAPPPQGRNAFPAARGDAPNGSQPALGPRQGTPQQDLTRPVADASSDASRARQKATTDQPARARASAVTRQRTSTPGDAVHTLRVADREAAPVALGEDHPCASGSLAVAELRRCARASAPSVGGTPQALPGLGGPPLGLLPVGLVLLGGGVVLVALGRRRTTPVVPVT